jgi:thermostable 8-oxoguanine DNA glycosylase
MYRYVGGREPSQEEVNIHMAGTPESLMNGFIAGGDLEVNRLRKQLADVQTALRNEQSKPPREIVKEVEKIITVEKPVEVPMTDDKGWNWLVSKIKGIFTK